MQDKQIKRSNNKKKLLLVQKLEEYKQRASVNTWLRTVVVPVLARYVNKGTVFCISAHPVNS